MAERAGRTPMSGSKGNRVPNRIVREGILTSERVDDRSSERKSLAVQQEKWFGEWWAVYWRRESRKPAWEKFRRMVLTEERFQEVMKATRAQT
jgi:hypothetical protein